MKRERLDQILIRFGMLSDHQIKQALIRQKSRGGRLGTHLLYYRFLSEEQLVHALSEQFGVPGIQFSGQAISDQIIRKLPKEFAEEHMVFPFRYETENRTLCIAMKDPDNAAVISHIKKISGALNVNVYIAAETVLKKMIESHYGGEELDLSLEEIIELPDLFDEAESPDIEKEDEIEPAIKVQDVVMITDAAFLKHFLPSLFEREGYNLTIVCSREEVIDAFQKNTFDSILLSKDMEEEFHSWITEGLIPSPYGEIRVFSTVSSALLANPVPYDTVFSVLLRTIRQIAGYRSSQASVWTPPYRLISSDIQNLSHSLGLRRIASDGLQIASYLLIPSSEIQMKNISGKTPFTLGCFEDFEGSVEIARSLSFPWDIEECLNIFAALISQETMPDLADSEKDDRSLAAQILVLLWYRYFYCGDLMRSHEENQNFLKSELRKMTGHLYAQRVVEGYLHLLEETEIQGVRHKDIFMISQLNTVIRQFVTHLKGRGFRTVEINDFNEVGRLLARQCPAAILLNYDDYHGHAVKLASTIEKEVLLYAFTKENNPSVVMDLLDSGFHDVFISPFNYEVVSARIDKSLSQKRLQETVSQRQEGLHASFREITFVDLIQALAGSLRSVHILLERGNGERGEVYLQKGKMVCAVCGKLTGANAVYKIISWREDGVFRTAPVSDFPPANILEPNDFILLEGCRRLDETEEN